jgi:hypothetical protein
MLGTHQKILFFSFYRLIKIKTKFLPSFLKKINHIELNSNIAFIYTNLSAVMKLCQQIGPFLFNNQSLFKFELGWLLREGFMDLVTDI